MKFVLEKVGLSGARIGRMTQLKSSPNATFETPRAMITTRGGSVPHLTPDVLYKVVDSNCILNVPVQHFCQMHETLVKFGNGIAKFAGLSGHPIAVSVQDVCNETPQGVNDKRGVKTTTDGSRVTLTPELYMDLVESMLPDWYETLNDSDTPINASRNRFDKSMSRSEDYLKKAIDFHGNSETLKDCGLFAPLLGGYDTERRTRWADSVKSDAISGYSLLGLHNNGEKVDQITTEQITDPVSAALTSLSADKPRQAPGAWSPLVIIHLCELGVDIFDCALPFMATERKAAFVFPNKLQRSSEESTVNGSSANSFDHEKKRLKLDEELLNQNHEQKTIIKERCYEISLLDKRNFDLKEPLLPGCDCYACKQFSKSYIHHLAVTNEMLAYVLLMIHNLHHWMAFFGSIRKAIRDDELDTLKRNLKK